MWQKATGENVVPLPVCHLSVNTVAQNLHFSKVLSKFTEKYVKVPQTPLKKRCGFALSDAETNIT